MFRSEEMNFNMQLSTLLRGVEKTEVSRWALECAEHVHDVYSRYAPRDRRLQQAVKTARRYLRGEADRAALRMAELAVREAVTEAEEDEAHLCAMATFLAVRAARSPRFALRVAATTARVRDSERVWQLQKINERREHLQKE